MQITYGALPPKTDLRDYKVAGSTQLTGFRLENLPKVKNQGSVGSCVAHATSSILEWYNLKEMEQYHRLSPGFIYGMQGEISNRMKPGMYLRDACKIVQQYGDCRYEKVPYNIEMPECYEKLQVDLADDSEDIYLDAYVSRVKSYARCLTEDSIKYALVNHGPVLMSVKWYNNYTLSDDSIISFDTASSSGYHAIMVYGYDERGWICQNSWGTKWGAFGRFTLPYKYGFAEAWSFVDAENTDVYKPKRNAFLDVFYNLINSIINLFKGA